ncbi:MAG: hypothetical protein ABIV43_00350, partial [Candidatus Saccharimonadales bacterium]
LHATWESTHTFLILGVNYFVWLYSAAVVTVGRAVFIPLLVFGAAFVVRAILYIQLFYLRSSPKPNVTIDRLFAWAHVAMAGCLAVIVYRALKIMLSNDYTANHLLLPLLLPGLLLLVPLISVPLYFLYKTKTT